MGQLKLKPFSFLSLLYTAFSLYRRNFALFFWLTAIFFLVPTFISQFVMIRIGGAQDIFTRMTDYANSVKGDPAQFEAETAGTFLNIPLYVYFIYAFILLVTPFATGVLINAIHCNALGKGCGFRDAFTLGARKYINIFLSSMLVVIIVTVCTSPLAIPFILAMTMKADFSTVLFLGSCILLPCGSLLLLAIYVLFLVYMQTLIIEGRGPLESLTRSARLVWGWGPFLRAFMIIFCLQLILSLVYNISESGFRLLHDAILYFNAGMIDVADSVTAVGLTIVQIFVKPVLVLGQTILFYDLKVRREAYDVENKNE